MTHHPIFTTLIAAASIARTAAAQHPTRISWNVKGAQREALVFAPSAPAPDGKAPVILVFHGHGGNMRGSAAGMHFQRAWPEALVVYLQGLPTSTKLDPGGSKPGWEAEPSAASDNRDIDFVDAVLATLRQRFAVDTRRIYATGFSNGAFFCYALLALRGETFAAIAPVAGLARTWQPAPPRPVFVIGGNKDPLVKPDSQRVSLARVRELDGATGPGRPCGAGCMFFPSTTATPVRSVVHDGGHVFPPFATQAIVAFFKNHSLPN
jgi:polyhydroxybutyrate depolymerase